MRRFILGWEKLGYESRLQARIVNYDDDFVVLCCNRGQEAYAKVATLMEKLKLEINPDKTRVCRVGAITFVLDPSVNRIVRLMPTPVIGCVSGCERNMPNAGRAPALIPTSICTRRSVWCAWN